MKPRVIREAPGEWVVTTAASRLVCGTWEIAIRCALNMARQTGWEQRLMSRLVDMETDNLTTVFR